MSALHVPLGWHARGDHAEVELDDDRNVHPLRSAHRPTPNRPDHPRRTPIDERRRRHGSRPWPALHDVNRTETRGARTSLAGAGGGWAAT